jgi:hypothetical protein
VRKLLRKRRLLASLFALVFLAVAAWFEPTCVVRGWLCGEAFYQGRPTSYWSRELGRWSEADFACSFRHYVAAARAANLSVNELSVNESEVDRSEAPENTPLSFTLRVHNASTIWFEAKTYTRTPGLLDKLAGYFGIELDHPARPPLLDGDPDAEPVLRELLDDPSEGVRTHAQSGLRAARYHANRLPPAAARALPDVVVSK